MKSGRGVWVCVDLVDCVVSEALGAVVQSIMMTMGELSILILLLLPLLVAWRVVGSSLDLPTAIVSGEFEGVTGVKRCIFPFFSSPFPPLLPLPLSPRFVSPSLAIKSAIVSGSSDTGRESKRVLCAQNNSGVNPADQPS